MMYRLYLKSAQAEGNPEARAVATKAIRELEGETAAPAATPVVTPPPLEARTAAAYVAAPAASIAPLRVAHSPCQGAMAVQPIPPTRS
jgi:hypothetical protein